MSPTRSRCLAPLVLVAAGLFACSGGDGATGGAAGLAARGAKPPNIVLIVCCTLRADHLPFHGYDKNTAPFLDRMASESVVFDHAFSTSGWTAPATASLHTGLYPVEHGVIYGMAHTEQIKKVDPTIVLNRIPDRIETLAEVLSAAGYTTFAVTDNLNICEKEGFDQGFDRFQNFRDAGAPTVIEQLIEWQDQIEAANKSFVYLNFFDPHYPYHKRSAWFPPGEPELEQPVGTKRQPTREEFVNAYDSEINYLDRQLPALFERFGWGEDTLVVITSDHGEEFGDHGGWEHGYTLFQEITHIPMMFRGPGGGFTPRRVDTNVSLVDLLPTMRELLGLPPSERDSGMSLAPLIAGDEASEALRDRVLFGHIERRKSDLNPEISQRFAVLGNWKMLTTTGEIPEALFDLASDPGEQHNVIADHPEVAAALRQSLAAFEKLAEQNEGEQVELEASPELLEQLKQLGYVR